MRRARIVAAYLAGLTALALAAGCGSAPFGASAALSRSEKPAGGSPALARLAGQRMLDRLVLPHGSQRIGWRARPTRPEVIGTPNLVDVRRFFLVPLPPGETYTFLRTHHPAGATATGYGRTSSGDSVQRFVSYQPKSPPRGISAQSQLLVSLAAAGHGGTVLRADAEMVWFTPRSAADYLRPSRYREVLARLALQGSRPVGRTITSHQAIRRLARLFNSLHTVVPGPVNCPAWEPGSFRLAFVSASGGPAVVVTSSFCMGDLVTVRGRAQPVLFDPESMRALALISRLLGVQRGHG